MSTTHRDTEMKTATPAIRPFSFTVSDEALADLRRRVAATIWPDKEIVADRLAGRAVRDDAGSSRSYWTAST